MPAMKSLGLIAQLQGLMRSAEERSARAGDALSDKFHIQSPKNFCAIDLVTR
jgi:hypothetical protein